MEFVDKSEISYRSKFANDVCQLIIDKNNKSLIDSLKEIGDIYDHFEIHVKNIYELIDSEIPLFCLYDLIRHGRHNWHITEEEYAENKLTALRACSKYYRISIQSIIDWEKENF